MTNTEYVGEYTLINGKVLKVSESYIKRMTGKPEIVVNLTIDDIPTTFQNVLKLLYTDDIVELGEYIDEIYRTNYNSATSHTI